MQFTFPNESTEIYYGENVERMRIAIKKNGGTRNALSKWMNKHLLEKGCDTRMQTFSRVAKTGVEVVEADIGMVTNSILSGVPKPVVIGSALCKIFSKSLSYVEVEERVYHRYGLLASKILLGDAELSRDAVEFSKDEWNGEWRAELEGAKLSELMDVWLYLELCEVGFDDALDVMLEYVRSAMPIG